MSECICRNIPKNRAGAILASNGAVRAYFHMDCPIHGIVVKYEEKDNVPATETSKTD